MRHRGIAPWVLILALGVSAAGPAAAQVPTAGSQGGLITRYFKRPAATAPRVEKEDPKVIPAVSPAVVKQARQSQALADWMRRAEVCLKLRDIAHETGDDELWRDIMRAEYVDGHSAELRQLLGELMQAREAEVPEDLSKDTYAWLRSLMPDILGASANAPV